MKARIFTILILMFYHLMLRDMQFSFGELSDILSLVLWAVVLIHIGVLLTNKYKEV